MKDASLWIPLIIGFYVIVLGLCLTGALKRQKIPIRELRREQSAMFSMLDEEESDDEKAEQRKRPEGKRRGVGKRDWEGFGCR